MFSKFAAVIAAGVLVATGLATSATAAAPFTDTVRISGNFDNGNHGYWAALAYNRTVTIQPTDTADEWAVALRDVGSFTTIRNAKSPEVGADLGSPVTGRFTGRYDFTVTSQTKPSDDFVKRAYDFRCNPAVPNRGDCAGMPKSTGEWPALYFPQGAQVEAGAWRWEYRTCAETWVNSSVGNSGDITGKRCDSPVRADEPTAKDPACDASKGTLTVPSDRGVAYRVNGKVWRAGTYDVRPGVYRVTAHARDGYRLVGDERWRLTVDRAEACPSPSPSPSVSPTVSPSPSSSPTDTPEVREVTPKAPVLTQATCDDKTASVTIPEQDGVIYKTSGGTVLEQGKTYTAKPGSVTVTFEAEDGYKLADGVEPWTKEVAEAPTDCPTATPTTTTTPVTVVNNIPVPSRVDTGLGGLAR